jgi:hypothetical protein
VTVLGVLMVLLFVLVELLLFRSYALDRAHHT